MYPGGLTTTARCSGSRVRVLHSASIALLLLAAVTFAACEADILDPDPDVVGPAVELAPQTVALSVPDDSKIVMGDRVNIIVSANTGAGTSGLVRIGATALILDESDRVVEVIALGPITFDQPESGTVTRTFSLEPRPDQVRIDALPDTLRYEIHGYAYSGGGVCVAATGSTPERRPCGMVEEQPVAGDAVGESLVLEIIAPQVVSVSGLTETSVALGSGIPFTVTANTGSGSAGVVRIGATAIIRDEADRVLHVIGVGPRTFDAPQDGTVREEFLLSPDPAHVDLDRLPENLRYEVHGYAISGQGICVAAADDTLARHTCEELQGHPVAEGVRGDDLQVEVLAPHRVAFQTSVPARMEPGDTARFRVSAEEVEDVGGIMEVGVGGLVRNAAGDTAFVQFGRDTFATGQPEVQRTLRLTYRQIRDRTGLAVADGEVLSLALSAYAIHETGACVAAVGSEMQQLPCEVVGNARFAADGQVRSIEVTGVEGRSVALPNGAVEIGDLLVHNATNNLFLSNRAGHRVEVLNLANMQFRTPVNVGSEPWGLDLSTQTDELIVANSGGTNVSFVSLSDLRENVGRRFEIPRIKLHEYRPNAEPTQRVTFYSYADRPQHIAQDSQRRLLYSASSTQAAPIGTIRAAEWHSDAQTWSARFLFPEGSLANTLPVENRAVVEEEGTYAIANIDSMTIVFAEENGDRWATDSVVIFDHVVDRNAPNNRRTIQSDTLPFEEAVADIRAKGSDLVRYGRPEGRQYRWNIPPSIETGDTTFVAASGNRDWVAFGYGVHTEHGRAVLWGAEGGSLSRVDDIHDMINNTSDRLRWVNMDRDGSLLTARGTRGVYFLDRDLRLQGLVETHLGTGGGLDLLPNQPRDRSLAFIGTGVQSIQIIEPVHFRVVGELPVRSNIAGPLRVAPAVDATRRCPTNFWNGSANCVVATVYGVSDAGTVISVDVLRRHLEN